MWICYVPCETFSHTASVIASPAVGQRKCQLSSVSAMSDLMVRWGCIYWKDWISVALRWCVGLHATLPTGWNDWGLTCTASKGVCESKSWAHRAKRIVGWSAWLVQSCRLSIVGNVWRNMPRLISRNVRSLHRRLAAAARVLSVVGLQSGCMPFLAVTLVRHHFDT